MRHILWSAATAALLFASCAKDDAEVVNLPASDDFTATLAAESRTVLDGTSVLWEADDLLTIFTKTNHNRQYKVKSLDSDQRTATFGYVSYTSPESVETISSNYALYPYDAEATLVGDVITTTLATEQVYDAEKVDLANSLMVAKSSDNALSFKNAGALVRFKLSKEDLPDSYTLQSIKLVSAANKIAGEAAINTGAECTAVVTENGVNTVALTGINTEITTTQQLFYIALPATVFEAWDLTVTFVYTEGEKSIKLPAFTLAQNSIKTFSYTIKADDFEGTTPDDMIDGEPVAPGVVKNEAGEYEISTAEGLVWFGTQITSNLKNFRGETVKVVAPIDMAGVAYPAGSIASYPSYAFQGTFDGGNNAISNLTIAAENDTYGCAALIPAVSTQGTIQNVTIKNVNLNSSHYAGAIWGYMTADSGLLTVTNCHIDGGTITSHLYNGDNGDKVGGLGGIFYHGEVSGCSVKNVTITGYRDMGGLVGWCNDAAATVKNNTIENVTLVVNNTTNYESYKYQADYDVDSYAGEADAATVEGNTGAATINWGEIPAAFTIESNEDAGAVAEAVATAIAAGETRIALPASETAYVIPSAAQGKTVTFVGTDNPEDVAVAVTKVGSGGENCDYGLDGSTVTFENITITTNSSTYIGYARCKGTYKNCIINGTYTLYGDSTFEGCTFNVSGDVYNIWTWGAKNMQFTNCTFNSDGKALLLYQEGTNTVNLTVKNCTFNDKGGLTAMKAAIEIGDAPYGATPTYNVTVSGTTVNGYEINDAGINTGSTLWGNKDSMPDERLNVTVDGVVVY